MIIHVTWETTPDELRHLADLIEANLKKGIKLWGQDRVVETIHIEQHAALRVGYPNELWEQALKEKR